MEKTNESFTFNKRERLTGTKRINHLFTEGKGFISYPLRVIYLLHEQNASAKCSILVSVPKKRIKKAVHRNRIKRLIRESYRLNKTLITNEDFGEKSMDIAFIYVKDNESNFQDIQKAMQKALNQIADQIKKA